LISRLKNRFAVIILCVLRSFYGFLQCPAVLVLLYTAQISDTDRLKGLNIRLLRCPAVFRHTGYTQA